MLLPPAPHTPPRPTYVAATVTACFQPDNTVQMDAGLLAILKRLAAVPAAARRLRDLGADRVLAQLHALRPVELQPLVHAVLGALMAVPTQVRYEQA